MSISGVEFESAYENRIEIMSAGVKMDFISLDDLIRAKLSSGRPRDLLDARKLQTKVRPSNEFDIP